MRSVHRVCTLALALMFGFLLAPGQGDAKAAGSPPTRGIAVFASSLGSDFSPEGLAQFVRAGRFSPVIVDWAWITAHWDATNFPALNRFIEIMAADGVPVAAMYRPRFLKDPTVPVQVDRAGKAATSHGFYICFSSPQARQWGAAWGTRILQRCPRISEIIIYNPLNQCRCPACLEAARHAPFAHYDAVWKFLAEAKAAWREQRPGAKLGVVFVNDPEFWRRGAGVLDAAHPFLFVQDDTDMAKDMAAATAIRNLLPGKAGPCLAKVTWGPNDKVSPARLAEFDRLAAQAGLPYFFWTFDTLFTSGLYDPTAVAQALGLDAQAITGAISRMHQALPMGTGQPGSMVYSPDEIRSTSAQVFLNRMVTPEPGYEPVRRLQRPRPESQGKRCRGPAADHLPGGGGDEGQGPARVPALDVLQGARRDRRRAGGARPGAGDAAR